MPLEPVVQSGCGMGETELRPALHQVEGGSECSFSRLPGVRDRPEPGQIEMSVAQPVHRARRSGRRGQLVGDGIDSSRLERIKLLPVSGKVSTGCVMKLQGFRHKDPSRVMGWTPGFPIQRAADQSSVVMQRTTKLQLQLQSSTAEAALRKCPATGGIEQIPLMHQDAIHPEPGHFSPPAQTKSTPTAIPIPPLLRPMQTLLQPQPLTTPGPDQQTPLSPVRAVGCPPVVLKKSLLLRSPTTTPCGPQITARATAKRFNPRRSPGLQGVLPPCTAVMPHRMLSQSQTTVGLHACPKDLRLLGRLLLYRNFCLRFPGERSQSDPQSEGSGRLTRTARTDRARHWSASCRSMVSSCQDPGC